MLSVTGSLTSTLASCTKNFFLSSSAYSVLTFCCPRVFSGSSHLSSPSSLRRMPANVAFFCPSFFAFFSRSFFSRSITSRCSSVYAIWNENSSEFAMLFFSQTILASSFTGADSSTM
eukprot:Amastigsp_a848127_17.p3 type:complete len:117 gc:universal Amastigsp_a848127_17:728-378(-)